MFTQSQINQFHHDGTIIAKNLIKGEELEKLQEAADKVVNKAIENKPEDIPTSHLQVGIDDCSTDLELRGAPVFRSLVGPMPEGKNVIRYETPEVFEMLTKEWAIPKAPKRRSRKKKTATNG